MAGNPYMLKKSGRIRSVGAVSEKVLEKLARIPEQPGIYKMLDSQGTIIYIGKSKCLKKRVHSYFTPQPKWDKAKDMRSFIDDIEYQVTDTHLEAMLLECELIKAIKPAFNIMMKGDDHFFYLTVGRDSRKGPLKTSGERQEDSLGPLRGKGGVETFIEEMKTLYPLEKIRGRYRWEYHILPVNMNEEEFRRNREILREIFSDSKALGKFQKSLENEMQKAAKNQQYERAARYRNLSREAAYLGKCLRKYEIFLGKELLYRVPLEQGCKFFYIEKGMVAFCRAAKADTPEERERFLLEARKQGGIRRELKEKERADFQDILFSEIQNAPEDMTVELAGNEKQTDG